jgi:hypothetical protein
LEHFKHIRVNSRVLVDELFGGDLILGLDRVVLVTGDNLVELVVVLINAYLGRRFTVVGRRRSSRGSICAGDIDIDVVV